MKERTRRYRNRIDAALATPRLQEALHRFGDAYVAARQNAFAGSDLEALREAIAAARDEVRENRATYIARFTEQATAAGATVHFARTAAAANAYIATLARSRGVQLAVKSKSMTSEETGLNAALADAGVRTVETDLGEWIVQLAGQRPSHMVMPAIHMFRDEVAELFGNVTGRREPADIPHLVRLARDELRPSFFQAQMGISGANIAVAETGGLVLVSNEGNARLVTTLPKIHVALVGIEKIVPQLEDAVHILQALPRNATGQRLTSYISWITGLPDNDGGRELHIVLLDNGRSAIADSPPCRDAWRCLKCGACANVCPVYQTVGGHVFGHIYVGAIGIVLTAFFHGLDHAAELVRACIGCRACVAVCPGKIDLERMILHLRDRVGRQEGVGTGKALVFRQVLRNRKLFHALLRTAAVLQRPLTRGERSIRHLPLFFSPLTEWRTLPAIAGEPLRDCWPQLAAPLKAPRLRVAFFAGCLIDFVYPEIGAALVRVLNRLQVAVVFPPEQNCCGIPALYAGDAETAAELARQNVRALLAESPDFVVTACPTCTLALQRDFAEQLGDDPQWRDSVRRLAAITVDVSRFIADQLDDSASRPSRSPAAVTYHDSCHLRRGAGVWAEPRRLLAGSGRPVVEMAHADRCCGFGGSYSFTSHPAIARRLLDDKLADIAGSGAACVAMDCPGCLLQIRGGLEKGGSRLRAAHTIELLAEDLDPAAPPD